MPPSDIDLTDVGSVKAWAEIKPSNTSEDATIQLCITAFSAAFLTWTGNAEANGEMPDESPFCSEVEYEETYDGNGSDRLWLDHRPIKGVSSLLIDGVSVIQSQAFNQPGFVIDKEGQSLQLRGGGGGSGSYFSFGYPAGGAGSRFSKGVGNIAVAYTAGFRTTPLDIQVAANIAVTLNYKRRGNVDVKTNAMAAGAGTISYRDWQLPPEVQKTILDYTRFAIC